MILSGKTIQSNLVDGSLVISPFEPNNIQPASIDLRIDNHFLELETHQSTNLSLDHPAVYRDIYVDDYMVIPPHSFILATTMEYIEIPATLTAFVEGRSSIGRLGLFIQNAGWIDPGFKGNITLELFNANSLPIRLAVGRRVCQIVFAYVDQEADLYKGKYIGQKKATASQIYLDREM